MADEPFVMPKPVKRAPLPEIITIYDADGNAREKFPVDAAECVATGRYFYEKPEGGAEKTEAAEEVNLPDAEQSEQSETGEGEGVIEASDEPETPTTKAELIEAIRAAGGQATAAMNKTELVALYESLPKGDE